MSDTSLQRDVMQALADNQLVFPDEIAAQVVGDDVTLRGTVGSVQQRDEAGRSTQWVPGVRHVDNQLRVRPLDSDRRADADTQAAVMDALSAHPGLHPARLDAIATAGTVTLRGVVDTPDLRGKAAQIAFQTSGVTEVHNKIEVAS
ncbi:BON domain-containing protein [Solirubrobacter ginsenosidimutans]|uniref:BON domain-containing protein n=1 Tax=Solirubrobacter ginsenosidimutans TaxID=490573 RepID=A0A9X3S2B6_9ACTN|nr:BON domain-containing protein [Solirubrobacter ginsenosidimutans]MDA0164400.1 BON domain-containing protein [Solirubrobacter ginsenosidimutans]